MDCAGGRPVDELHHRVDHRSGWSHDLDPIERHVEEHVRLDDPQPLVHSVAELIVMTGPMSQVGWASASWGVTRVVLARPPERPPLAVTTRPRPRRPTPRRHWASAECSPSTGDLPRPRGSALTRGPPTISDSLLARARVVPRSARPGSGETDRPGDPVEDHVGRATAPAPSRHRGRPGSSVCVQVGRCSRPRSPRRERQLHGPAPQAPAASTPSTPACRATSSRLRPPQGGDAEPVRRCLRDLDRLRADGAGRPEQGHGPRRRGHPAIVPCAMLLIARLIMARVTGSWRNCTGRK